MGGLSPPISSLSYTYYYVPEPTALISAAEIGPQAGAILAKPFHTHIHKARAGEDAGHSDIIFRCVA